MTKQEAMEAYMNLSAERNQRWEEYEAAYANLKAAQAVEAQALDAWIAAMKSWRETCDQETDAQKVFSQVQP